MDLNHLYTEKILALASNIPQPGRLVQPDASARKVSRVCGAMIEVDIMLSGGVITGYGHAVSACALGQISAAVVAREIVGTSATVFRGLCGTMHAMLKKNGLPPGGKWRDLACLEPVRHHPARHASTLLVFDAVVEAIEKYELLQMIRHEN